MTDRQQAIETAKQLGAAAFAAGIKCAPALDSKMMDLLKGREIGDKLTTAQLKAWSDGWTAANLAPQMTAAQKLQLLAAKVAAHKTVVSKECETLAGMTALRSKWAARTGETLSVQDVIYIEAKSRALAELQ